MGDNVDDDNDFDFFDFPGRTDDAAHGDGFQFDRKEPHFSASGPKSQHGNRQTKGGNSTDSDNSIELEGEKYMDNSGSAQYGRSTPSQKRIVVEAEIPSVSLDSNHSSSDSSDDYHSDRDNRTSKCNPAHDIEKNCKTSSKSHVTSRTRQTSERNTIKKPPLPHNGRSAWHDELPQSGSKSSHHKNSSVNIENSNGTSSMPLESTSNASDGRKMRKGQHRYNDQELSLNDTSSSEEEANRRRSRPRRLKDPKLKIDVNDDISPRSRSDSGSRSNSSQWSTGSDEVTGRQRGPRQERPTTRLSHRRSSSDSSITVSSLSDDESPARKSQDVTFAPSTRYPDTVDKDRLNLELLLSALLDADKDVGSGSARLRDVPQRSTQQQRSTKSRSNYTFSSDRARVIDMENQRLLNNILAHRSAASHSQADASAPNRQVASKEVPKAKTKKQKPDALQRVTHASLNRIRDQQRIERENLAMLRRINQIKPSNDVSRTKNLCDYNKQMAYHCPELRTASELGGSTASRSKSSLSMTGSNQGGRRTRPASASYSRPTSAYSEASIARSSCPSSATSLPLRSTAVRRPASAGRVGPSSLKKRPEWQSGW